MIIKLKNSLGWDMIILACAKLITNQRKNVEVIAPKTYATYLSRFKGMKVSIEDPFVPQTGNDNIKQGIDIFEASADEKKDWCEKNGLPWDPVSEMPMPFGHTTLPYGNLNPNIMQQIHGRWGICAKREISGCYTHIHDRDSSYGSVFNLIGDVPVFNLEHHSIDPKSENNEASVMNYQLEHFSDIINPSHPDVFGYLLNNGCELDTIVSLVAHSPKIITIRNSMAWIKLLTLDTANADTDVKILNSAKGTSAVYMEEAVKKIDPEEKHITVIPV